MAYGAEGAGRWRVRPELGGGARRDEWGRREAAGPAEISDNGRYVAFATQNTELPEDVGGTGKSHVFRRDCEGTEILQVSTGLDYNPFGQGSNFPSLSADGRYVAFSSSEWGAGQPNVPFQCWTYRRDCDDASGMVSLGLTTADGSRPSLAAGDPTLCQFFSSLLTTYGVPTGQVYVTFTPR